MDIVTLAQKSSAAKLRYEAMSVMNMPVDPAKRVAVDAHCRMLRDAWLAAEAEYQRVLNRMSADDLRRAVG